MQDNVQEKSDEQKALDSKLDSMHHHTEVIRHLKNATHFVKGVTHQEHHNAVCEALKEFHDELAKCDHV